MLYIKQTTMRLCAAFALVASSAPLALASSDGEQPNLFASDIGNVIFTLIIFGLVVALLGMFAWKPILKVLQEREQTIHDALVDAKKEREEADRLLTQYREQVDKAREEATEIVEEGKRDAESVRRRIHEEAQDEAKQMIERAKREIQLATDDAIKSIYDETANIAVNVAGNVIRKELSTDDHKQLISESIDRIQQSKNAKFN